MKNLRASATLTVILLAVLCGTSPAEERSTLVYYGPKTVDRLYEEDVLYGPLLKTGTDRYFRPIVLLKGGGGFLDPYLVRISTRRDLLGQMQSESGCRVIQLGKCFGYDDFVLSGPGPRPPAEPGPAHAKGKKGKASAGKATGLVLSNARWDIYDMGGSRSRVLVGSVESPRWQGYSRKDPNYYNRVAESLWKFDKELNSSVKKPSFRFISVKDGVIGSYRFFAKSIEGSVYMVDKFFTVLNAGDITILPLQYGKARDSEIIYLADFDGNGTDNFALLIKYWDKGVYFSQASVYEFRDGWELVYRSIPFGCHKQVGYEEF